MFSEFYVVPNSIVFIIEQIVRSTIRSKDIKLEIELYENDNSFFIKYIPRSKINHVFNLEKLADLKATYGIYHSEGLHVFEEDNFKIISLPKLLFNQTYENSTY